MNRVFSIFYYIYVFKKLVIELISYYEDYIIIKKLVFWGDVRISFCLVDGGSCFLVFA